MEFLCINRDKPALDCEGKCHLSKKLKAQDESEKQTNNQSQNREVQLVLFCQSFFYMQTLWPPVQEKANTACNAGIPSRETHSIFHPPRSIV